MEQHPNMKYDLSFLDDEIYKAVEPFPERKPLPPFQQRFLALLLENQCCRTTARLLEFDPYRAWGVCKCLSRKNWIRIYHVYPEREENNNATNP